MAEDPLQCHKAIRGALVEERGLDEMLRNEEEGETKEIRIEEAGLTLKLKVGQL